MNIKKLFIFFILSGFSFLVSATEITQEIIGNFSSQSLKGWKEKSFVDHSVYDFEQMDNEWVLRAQSDGTASALFYEQEIDLNKTPYLNWRWRIDGKLDGTDEKTKAGDDYVARIYVVRDGGLFIWNTIAINYVWSNQQKQFDSWDNAFAKSNARMFSLRDSTAEVGKWYVEKRNILIDFKKFFPDEKVTKIDGVALMTDTDNTKGHAKSYFGDIFFTAK